ncbi:MAG: hypothetical protein H6830_02900 [Planctomycetes bacterium]|nr:hypothetical protein [Planctomycetota bacterium]MCB9910108.1 hypothetical protein [Planctomycetota bacterium]
MRAPQPSEASGSNPAQGPFPIPLDASGCVVLEQGEVSPSRIALVQTGKRWVLPRVLLQAGESHPSGVQRALLAQVGEGFPGVSADWIATLDSQIGARPVRTTYWKLQVPRGIRQPVVACEWVPVPAALSRLTLPEERSLVATMQDPLAHPPLSPRPAAAASAPQEAGPGVRVRPPTSPSSSRGAPWQIQAQDHPGPSHPAQAHGPTTQAQDSLIAAWKLEFESKSVSERRLWTRLLQGEVRARTQGWRREALLSVLDEVPDAGTLARVRAEVQAQKERQSAWQQSVQRARWVQMALALPPVLALCLFGSTAWFSGTFPAIERLWTAVLGLGLVGGLAWSTLRQVPTHALAAVAPLAAGSVAALLAFLLERGGILRIAQDSAPGVLALALVSGWLGASLVGLKPPGASGPPAG